MALDPAAAHAAVDALVTQHDALMSEAQGVTAQLTAENGTLRQTLDRRDLALAAQAVTLDAARSRPAAVEVQAGETMTSIAGVHGVTRDQVKAWNPTVVPTKMPVGTKLWLIDRATVPSADPAPNPEPRFPGDPGPGKVIVGMATTGGNLAQIEGREKHIGMGLAFRVFDNGGISDLAVRAGSVCKKILRDHAAGRLPVVSPKPGIEALAARRFGPELEAFFRWTEVQPGITAVIVHHEAENDWKAEAGDLTAYAAHAADFREAQRWVRECLNKAAGGRPNRTIFMGASMSYSWTPEGKRRFGPPENWNPGNMADGRHVWDLWGADHYEDSDTADSLDTQKWEDFVATATAAGCIPVITENGINNGNANGGKALAAFLEKIVTVYKCPMYLYFDSHAGPGGKPQTDPRDWWDLTEANGTLQAFTDFARRVGANPNA